MSAGPGGSYGSEAFEPESGPRRPSGRLRALGAKVRSPQPLIFCRTAVWKRNYGFCTRPVPLYMMTKKKNRMKLAKKIISSVKREMQKPRLAESVRSDKRDQAAPVREGLRVLRKSDGKSST
jgi:hypothetical protein